jgi:hypothetical protein
MVLANSSMGVSSVRRDGFVAHERFDCGLPTRNWTGSRRCSLDGVAADLVQPVGQDGQTEQLVAKGFN